MPITPRDAGLDVAQKHARAWLDSLDHRPVPARQDADEIAAALGALPEEPGDPAATVDLLARTCDPGLTAMPSGRFFGFVIGGSLPAALAADWLTTAWDQNSGLYVAAPAASVIEEVCGTWLVELFGLPREV